MSLLHIGGREWLDWPFQPEVILPLLLLQGAYLYAVSELRPRISDGGRVSRRQVALFSSGVLVLYLATGSIVDHLADNFLLSAHVVELVMITLVAAPLLIAGTPGWLVDYALRSAGVARVARLVTHPLVGLGAYNGVLLITHLPFFYEWALRNEGPHFLMHAMWFAAGVLMWWPILSPTPQLPRLSHPLQMGYLFFQSLVPAVLASFITFSDSVVYSFYEEAPRIWGLSPIEDQQIAGGLMKLFGSLILWSFLVAVFFRWYALEKTQEQGSRRTEVEEERGQERLTKWS
ncbi:MAG: cytochrome c oxidase assembly protein [Chloroflexi bacterium]|nr:cytochrome c oxidase assembly protein [Chloroflexota bacterium]